MSHGVSTSITAHAGGGQASATSISVLSYFNQVTTCATAQDSVALPLSPTLGKPYVIMNQGAAACAVFPGITSSLNSVINGYAANASYFIGSGAACSFTAVSNSAAGLVQWQAHGYSGPAPVIPISAVATLGPQHAGCVIAASQGAGYTLTLPAPTTNIGMKVTVIKADAKANTASLVVDSSGAGLLLGGWLNATGGTLTGATTAGTVARNFNFLNNACVLGDRAEFVSEGTHWNVQAIGGAAACFSIS